MLRNVLVRVAGGIIGAAASWASVTLLYLLIAKFVDESTSFIGDLTGVAAALFGMFAAFPGFFIGVLARTSTAVEAAMRGGIIGLTGSLLILSTTGPQYSEHPRLFVVGFFCTPLGVVIGLLARVIQKALSRR